ncbi:hypothetical protein EDD85DRAFT_962179 [Armillaria nabsnona]|nr:hypothetical protein EDD85DRAFT_962179 [Armillaria nabsnona]
MHPPTSTPRDTVQLYRFEFSGHGLEKTALGRLSFISFGFDSQTMRTNASHAMTPFRSISVNLHVWEMHSRCVKSSDSRWKERGRGMESLVPTSDYEHGVLPPWEEKDGMSVWFSTTMLRRFAWIKETTSFLSYLFVSSHTPAWLGCTTVELFNGDDWNILNRRIIVAQISSIIFNTSTIHFSTFPWDINRPILPTIYIADMTTSFPNPLR